MVKIRENTWFNFFVLLTILLAIIYTIVWAFFTYGFTRGSTLNPTEAGVLFWTTLFFLFLLGVMMLYAIIHTFRDVPLGKPTTEVELPKVATTSTTSKAPVVKPPTTSVPVTTTYSKPEPISAPVYQGPKNFGDIPLRPQQEANLESLIRLEQLF